MKTAFSGLTLALWPFVPAETEPLSNPSSADFVDAHIKDRLLKQRLFDQVYADDIFLDETLLPLLHTCVKRLIRLQNTVGYAHFTLLGFDEALQYSRSHADIGEFAGKELDFLEMIFYSRVDAYGFLGEKPIKSITGKILRDRAEKIPYTGHFLYRGKPYELYHDLKNQVGDDLILTSGIRGVMKQFLLFLNKAEESRGNLSMASRSLAPPGYSFHGIGDFDVGQKGFGARNFTEAFTRTRVYRQLIDLGFLRFRYERDNHLGVRFEPWHIEVV